MQNVNTVGNQRGKEMKLPAQEGIVTGVRGAVLSVDLLDTQKQGSESLQESSPSFCSVLFTAAS